MEQCKHQWKIIEEDTMPYGLLGSMVGIFIGGERTRYTLKCIHCGDIAERTA